MKTLLPFILLFQILSFLSASGQVHPVQVSTQLVPPYSVYLSDYATPGNEKLRVVITQRDLTRPSYPVRLKLSLESNGRVILRTSGSFNPAPIALPPGEPTPITGVDLQPYLDSRNLDFTGISREEYERTKALPEGSYQLCFTAYDYFRQDVAVSDPGCQSFWLAKSEPPLLNFPACEASLPLKAPQQVIFSWLSRNTASPNSASQTEYEFSLYEIRPAGRDANDVVLTSQPIFHTTTTETQLVYGMAEPLLLENMQYAWRVKAIDISGKDQFRNNGYSETCTFTYGGNGSHIQLQAVENFQISGTTERRADAFWTPQDSVEGYSLTYRKTKGSSYKWFTHQTEKDSTSIPDLEPDTEYEARVQAYIAASYGPYSDIEKFRTLKARVYACGDSVSPINASSVPMAFATPGMIIDVQGMDIMLSEVEGPYGEGLFKGKGQVSVGYFGGAAFHVAFNDLVIDENRVASSGRVDFITKGIDKWMEEEIKKQKQQQQEENREQYKDKEFYEKVVYYDYPIDNITVDREGKVTITSTGGETHADTTISNILRDNPGKAVIIQAPNGDQWVIDIDPATGEIKATKVPGGGLSPNMNVVVSEEVLAIVKRALIDLNKNKHTHERMKTLALQLQTTKEMINEHADNNNNAIARVTSDNDSPEESISNNEADSDPVITLVSYLEPETEDEKFGLHDDIYNSLTRLFFEKIKEYKVCEAIRTFALPENIGHAVALIAPELKIENRTLTEFIEQQKAQGMTTPEIVRLVGLSIENLLGSFSMIRQKM